jgi:hypothetical protein
MNNLYDVLEVCLQELENGANLETLLARYPDLARELRPILKAAVMAHTRSEAVSDPTPEAVRRGRAKLLQRASEMREAKLAPRKRMIPFFQRLAISFTLAALFLSSGTGLVSASSSALPGENLYPVKLTWENLRLFFTFNEEYRETLEHAFENERLHEVNELLVEGRHETIRFAGVYMEVNGMTYVSGIHVAVLDTSILPTEPLLNGMAVEVTGHTNAEGFVDIESITLLPVGSAVPPGEPVEVGENQNSNDIENSNKNENSSVNDNGDENINDSSDDNDNINDNESSADNNNERDGANDNTVDNSNDDNTNDDNSGSGDNNDDDNSDSGGGGGDDDSGDSGGGGDDSGGDDND